MQIPTNSLLRLPQVLAVVPVQKSCWYNGIKAGRFPAPVKIGDGRAAFWRASDIEALIENATPADAK